MNQIKQKIEEIGLSQREISKRLGKNASYLAGVFRTGLSTAKQAELMDDLEIVAGGGTIQSDDEIIAELSQKLADCQDAGIKALVGYGIARRQLTEMQVLDTEICRVNRENDMLCGDLQKLKRDTANPLDKNRAELSVKQNQLTQTQKYLMIANQNCELFETKYRKIALLNWALCAALVVVLILWVLA